MNKAKTLILLFALLVWGAWISPINKPVVYIIGDSTVKNGKNLGDGGMWGWGRFLPDHFDTTRISIENHAIGGRSSRTFQTDGRWDTILEKLKPGDFVIIQFGHNDGSPLADTARARGTIKGTGNESEEIYNPIRKQREVVYTYGWYMRKYITEAKAKGAIPIVCSPVPRDKWKGNTVVKDSAAYTKWAEEVAKAEKAFYVPLNNIVADRYDKLGEQKVRTTLFTTKDHTHTSEDGARLNAACVVEGIKQLQDCPLNKYFKP
jgi:rhamnogalacturonan acetylesterase